MVPATKTISSPIRLANGDSHSTALPSIYYLSAIKTAPSAATPAANKFRAIIYGFAFIVML
jgi:hypothetical protein